MFRFRYTGIEWLLTVSRGWQLSFVLTQRQAAGGDLHANPLPSALPFLRASAFKHPVVSLRISH